MPAPNRWFLYKRCGDIIEGTRLISFRVPLKETISNGFDKDERFTPTLLIRMIEEMGKKLGMVIDLTFTLKYYKPEEFQRFGVEYFKLKTEGHMVPSEDVYRKFSEVISSYLERNKDNDHLIGVHCTHGVNRTGYLICRYMIETMSFSAEDAISAFNKARRHPIERQNYIDDLKTRPRRDSNTSINEQCNKQSSSKPEGAKHYFKEKKRYNPENLTTLERYVDMQTRENTYDLEANLAVLKLYQLNPSLYQTGVAVQVLLKSLTNLPHTDFMLCKCLIEAAKQSEEPMIRVMHLADMLETCQFTQFWNELMMDPQITMGIVGFEDSIRKFVCHVVSITYQTIPKSYLGELLGGISDFSVNQWINKYGWTAQNDGYVFISNQEENIKTKNITEKISFETVASIMKTS